MSVRDYCTHEDTFGENACATKKKTVKPKSSTIDFTKKIDSDGNTEYTITYGGMILTPNLTKILCNQNGDILAYIDIKRLSGLKQKFNAQFKILWFGIQEWHPELIGDFKQEIDQDYTDKLGFPHFAIHPGYWEHDSEKHLYTFTQYSPFAMANDMDLPYDWFHVKTDLEKDGKIETNFHIFDKNDTRTYEYNTHPVAPTPKIELLTKYILYQDDIITKKEFKKYMCAKKIEIAKRNIKQTLNNVFTRKKETTK